MAPPGELRVNAGVVWLAGNTVWSTRERIRGEVLTTMRYTFTFTFTIVDYTGTVPEWTKDSIILFGLWHVISVTI